MSLKPKTTHISIKDIKSTMTSSQKLEMPNNSKSYKRILGNSFYKKIHTSSNFAENSKKKRYNQNLKKKKSPIMLKKKILLKIFQYYASYGERTNLKFLRSNKFHKMMNDAEIKIDKTSLDILFVAQNKHR